MKHQINEIKRMQELAGLVSEEEHNFLQFNPGEDETGGGVDVRDFAIAVAGILKDRYGEHDFERFLNTLTAELNKK